MMSINIITREEKSDSVGESLAAFFLYIVAIVPLTLWGGFVLKTLWNWFIAETFAGAPHLSIAPAIGVMLVANFIYTRLHNSYDKDESPLEAFFSDLFFALIYGGTILLMGSIVHSYM